MSPTILREGPYRFFFFSREELRPHVHVVCGDGEAKFWIEPVIALSEFTGIDARQLKVVQSIVEEHENEFRNAWRQHFGT